MFITQYMSRGDLENYYASKRVEGAPWAPAINIVNRWSRSILHALDFLHSCSSPVIHRDLKPLNILLTESMEVKVTDFGISRAVSKKYSTPIFKPDSPPPGEVPVLAGADDSDRTYTNSCEAKDWAPLKGQSTEHTQMTGAVGSFRYMAPEVARHEDYTVKVDIYAFGLVLYFMSCGRRPFHEYAEVTDVLTEYEAGNEPRPKASECPKIFRPIMLLAWEQVPAARPSARELVERLVEAHQVGNQNKCQCILT